MLRRSLFAAAIGLFASAAFAQNTDVIAARQALYKGMGEATKPVGAMLKGGAYDDAVVKKALATYADAAKKLPDLFPDDSKTGHDTEALPAIWEHKDDFKARFSKFGGDAEAAQKSITDQASFQATMPKIIAQCGGCHKEYRAK